MELSHKLVSVTLMTLFSVVDFTFAIEPMTLLKVHAVRPDRNETNRRHMLPLFCECWTAIYVDVVG
jgi:hypothetical protein